MTRGFVPLSTLIATLVLCPARGAEPARISLTTPRPYQVIQRIGFDPIMAAKQKSGEPAFGYADVVVAGEFVKGTGKVVWEYRTVLLAGATGSSVAWTKLDVRDGKASARVPAGGWYRLEIRGREEDRVAFAGSIEPVGVGEVFVVAGQSYATNCNDERLKVADPHGRVSAFDTATGAWRTANDPQLVLDGSDSGSIWPPLGDALCKELQVPIGFANVAVGATSSVQWLPDGALHPRLIKAGQSLGRFRAVLWQQGESDVIAKTTREKYVANLKTIRTEFTKACGVDAVWLLAKSTHHPTVYNDPDGEGRIRNAIDELTGLSGFRAGPDTDSLKGENRGAAKSRRHFSAIGQRHAAEMWFAVLKKELSSPRPLRETVSELRLLEPAWASLVVHRESSVLLQMRPDGPITARLAFPAAEIFEIISADRRQWFDLNADVKLSENGLDLTVLKPGTIEPIKAADFFPPKDAPNSYRHRLGHPEQNLLYRPGRWFHDRNVEITYRRREPAILPEKKADTLLPKTLARLKAGQPLVLGISGDSISTGLDASAKTSAPPYQPGYPDLVAAQLQSTFQCDVTLKNRAVSGWSVANGVADIDKLLAEKPHLIIVAYGMNDVGRRDPKWFGKQTHSLLERIRIAAPETEVILVSPMLGNAEWIHTPREMFGKYRNELKGLSDSGIALADVSAIWVLFLHHKHDLDLTGNGLNHPNDFGHRLYAQSILTLLTEARKNPRGK